VVHDAAELMNARRSADKVRMTPFIAWLLACGAFYLGAEVGGVILLVAGMLASIDVGAK
jgi:hypothetical protein